MGTGKRGGSNAAHRTSSIGSGSQPRANLPPKPVSQKRVRKSSTSANMPPPTQGSSSNRAAGQKGWSRRSASWTAQEDARLIELVKKESAVPPSISASKTWSRVASQLTNRTGKQCRERYLNQLKPGIRRDPWSSEEERILRETHAKIGNKWVTIAQQLPGRTDNCVKNHWNSMLRKRQRREAALRATEAEVVATLGKAQGHKLSVDAKSEAELSVHTGYATPSGVSSSYHDLPTSGVPSPYTASSPITPKRDSKLQISTLVASSGKELPTWSVPCVQHENMGFASNGSNSVKTRNTQFQMSIAASRTGLRDSFPIHSPSQLHAKNTSGLFPGEPSAALRGTPGCPQNATAQSKDIIASPIRSMMPIVPADQVCLRGIETTETEDIRAVPQVRRSSRLLSCSSKNNSDSSVLQKPVKSIRKAKGSSVVLSDGVGGNPLAALAAAASSVPPSPLTPESRFSGTSRSRSVSPDPRLWHARSKTSTACTNGLGGSFHSQREPLISNPSSSGNSNPEDLRPNGSDSRRG